MRVDFYHLTDLPLERALPGVVERVLAQGQRLLIVAEGDPQREALDRHLWSYEAESFLPHGRLGEADDADQPVLLAPDVNAANGARHLALVDGRWRDAALDFDRVFHFFDDGSIGEARDAWRALRSRGGLELHYWKRSEAGRWEDKAPVAKAGRPD